MGALTGEFAATYIREYLYNKKVEDLTEAEKRNISSLAQLASGLAVASVGGNTGDIAAAIASSKNAAENNGLSWGDGGGFGGQFIGINFETAQNYDGIVHAVAQGFLTQEETKKLIDDMNSGKFMYDPLRDNLKRLPEDIAILTTPYGDYIAFRDAETWGDYSIAAVGIIPFVKYIKIGAKVIKVETKVAQSLVKEAETAYKAGNITEGNRLMDQVANQSTQVETTVVKNSNLTNRMPSNSGTQASNVVTKPTDSSIRFIDNVNVVDIKTGERFTGTVDLKPTLDRIISGEKYPHKNDGSIFQNRPDKLTGETGLPHQPLGYYKEYVHPTPNIQGPGPQRIITGEKGEIYYTNDHYNTFIRIK